MKKVLQVLVLLILTLSLTFSFEKTSFAHSNKYASLNKSSQETSDNQSDEPLSLLPMSGTYTIGVGAGYNYNSFTSAVAALTSMGVSGPVVFNVASGTYNEQITIPAINGASVTNSITFKSISGDSTSVLIESSATGDSNNYVVKLNGADFIHFKHMTLKSTSVFGFSQVLVYTGDANNNYFENNILEAPIANITSTNTAVIYNSTGSRDTGNVILNNIIINGSYGIYWYYFSTPYETYNKIEGNTIVGFLSFGIDLKNQDSIQISRNTIVNNFVSNQIYGIKGMYLSNGCSVSENNISLKGEYENDIYGMSFDYCLNGLKISQNKINVSSFYTLYGVYIYGCDNRLIVSKNIIITKTTSSNSSLYFSNCDGSSNQKIIVANNMVSHKGGISSNTNVLRLSNNSYIDFYFNSFHIEQDAPNGSTVYQSSGSNLTFKNNIFSNKGGGIAWYISTTSAIIASDYNNFYTSGSTLAYWSGNKSNLAALKTASSKESNSISVDPFFQSYSDLHSNTINTNGIGTPIAGINTDIEGDSRNPSNPDIGADEFTPTNNDIGIIELSKPFNPCPATPFLIKIKLKNYGNYTLNSSIIKWSVNGILQNPYSSLDTIIPFNEKIISIGSFSFQTGINYSIKIWTESPNSSVDGNAFNDTLNYYNLKTSIPSGTYTIGGSNPDFTNFTSAINDLIQRGVCGPVIYNVAPGNYYEQLLIPEINGASTLNSITFQSLTGDSTSVILFKAAKRLSENFVVKLDGADYITFKKMTIKSTSSLVYSNVIVFINGAHNNNFENNLIEAPVTSVLNSNSAVIYNHKDTRDTGNAIINNLIKYGSYGLFWYGNSSLNESFNTIDNNIILDCYGIGIDLYYQDSSLIKNNSITISSATTTFLGIKGNYLNNGTIISKNNISIINSGSNTYGIAIYNSLNGLNVSQNQISISNSGVVYGILISNSDYHIIVSKNKIFTNSTGTTNGISLSGCDGVSGQNISLSNNMISHIGGTTNSVYGIYMSSITFVDVLYNSINIIGGSLTDGRGVNQGGGSNQTFLNNIFSNNAGGYALYISSPTAVISSNNNNIYSSGSILAYWGANKADLTALKSTSGLDINSISVNTIFSSQNDLHINSSANNNTAVPFVTVTDDIDGQLRSPITPDIGADEFNLAFNDAGIFEFLNSSSLCPNSSQAISLKLKNFGIDTMKNCLINWSVNNTLQVPYTSYDTLIPNVEKIIVIGNYTFISGLNYTIKFWTTSPNGLTDNNSLNDTLIYKTNMNLLPSGTYTIGGTSPNYQSFNDAIYDLKMKGICGPVVFNVAPGTYNEQIIIPPIPGVNINNTVTFQSANGDSNSVIITYAPIDTSDNWTVRLSGTDYIFFKKMTIKSTGLYYGLVVELINGANYNEFSNCVIMTNPGSSQNLGGIYAKINSNNSKNTFRSNMIYNGFSGIYLYGSSSPHSYSNLIEKNILKNQYSSAIFLSNQDSMHIIDNVINNDTVTSQFYYGLNGYYLNNNSSVIGNNINLTCFSQFSYGIHIENSVNGLNVSQNKISISNISNIKGLQLSYNNNGMKATRNIIITNSPYASSSFIVSDCIGTSLLKTEVSNNMAIHNGGTTNTAYALYLSNNNYIDFFYNSFCLNGGSNVNGRTVYLTGGTNNSFMNNISVNKAGGFSWFILTPTSVVSSNYNDFYTTGSMLANYGVDAVDLTTLRIISSKETNSISINPSFLSTTDLHLLSELTSAGTPIVSISEDIDGDTRNSTSPDIGADEISCTSNLNPPISNNVTVCYGSQIPNLTASGQTGSAIKWYSDSALTTLIYTGSSFPTGQTSVGNYTYWLTQSLQSCSSPKVSVNLTISSKPSSSITPSGIVSICTGDSIAINANVGSGITCKWMKDNLIIPGETNQVLYAKTSGFYKVIETNSNNCSDTSSTTKVIVGPINTNISIIGTLNFCLGGSATLRADTSQGLNYQWRKDGIPISGATSSNLIASQSGFYKVIISKTGCSDSSSIIPVTVYQLPIATATPAGPTSFCQGTNVTINASIGTGFSYQWKKDGINMSGANSSVLNTSQSGSYKVIIIDSNNCTDSSFSVIVTVNPLPLVSANPLGNTTFCQGDSVVINASVGTGYSYQWSKDGVNIIGAINSSLAATQSGTYKVLVTDGNNCSDSSSAIIVTVISKPVSTIMAIGDSNFCYGDSVILKANSITGLSYKWLLNGSILTGVIDSIYIAKASGSYQVIITNANNCPDTSTAFNVFVNALPVVNLGSDTVKVCVYNSIILDAGSGFVSYLWSTGNSLQTLYVDTMGVGIGSKSISVTVTDVNGCQGDDGVIVLFDPCLGILQHYNEFQLNLFPNPTSNELTVSISGASGAIEFDFITISGQIIFHDKMLENSSTSRSGILNLTFYPKGVYFIRIRDDKNVAIEKIILK